MKKNENLHPPACQVDKIGLGRFSHLLASRIVGLLDELDRHNRVGTTGMDGIDRSTVAAGPHQRFMMVILC